MEAGRTGKHGLTDPNDSTASDTSTMSYNNHSTAHVAPNITVTRPAFPSFPSTPSRECDVTSTRHTPIRSTDQSHTPVRSLDQSQVTPVRTIDQSQWYNLTRYAASMDQTPTNLHTPTSFLNGTDMDLTPVNSASNLTSSASNQEQTSRQILQTPVRRRITGKPAAVSSLTVTVAKTVSIPTANVSEDLSRDHENEAENGLPSSISTESINVTDD